MTTDFFHVINDLDAEEQRVRYRRSGEGERKSAMDMVVTRTRSRIESAFANQVRVHASLKGRDKRGAYEG